MKMAHPLLGCPRLSNSFSDSGICQPVGFNVVFARDVRYGEVERTGQFLAGPMQGIKSRAAAGVFPRHLLDHDFGIGKYMECSGAKLYRELQCFEKSDVLGNIVVVMSNRFVYFDRTVRRTVDHDADSGGARVPERSAIDVGNEIRHIGDTCWNNNA